MTFLPLLGVNSMKEESSDMSKYFYVIYIMIYEEKKMK